MELVENYIKKYKTFRNRFNIGKSFGKYYFNIIFNNKIYKSDTSIAKTLNIDIKTYQSLRIIYPISIDNTYIYFYDKKDIELFIKDMYKNINN